MKCNDLNFLKKIHAQLLVYLYEDTRRCTYFVKSLSDEIQESLKEICAEIEKQEKNNRCCQNHCDKVVYSPLSGTHSDFILLGKYDPLVGAQIFNSMKEREDLKKTIS